MIINNKPVPNISKPVDFGWYASGDSPSVGITYLAGDIGDFEIPGSTTLASSVTTPANTTTAFTMTVADASTFVGGSGTNDAGTPYAAPPVKYPVPISTLYVVNSSGQWAQIGYTATTGGVPITGNVFNTCFVINGTGGGTGLTFAAGSNVIDYRWLGKETALYSVSTTTVTFDAVDSNNLGLPNSKGANIVSYHWDFGNGLSGDGPVVETAYWYTGQLNQGGIAAPSQVMVTLTAVAITGEVFYVSHPVIFAQIYSDIGAGNPNVAIGHT